MWTHDEHRLVADLERLTATRKVAFALACAERLIPSYQRFAVLTGRGQPQVLTSSLERLWSDVLGEHHSTDVELAILLDGVMNQVPREDDEHWIPEQAAAEDSAAAVAYAIRCRRTGLAQEAAWAARRAYEAQDHQVLEAEKVEIAEPGADLQVLLHPSVQAELGRQQRDLNELLRGDARDETELLRVVRHRSRAEARIALASS